MIWCEYEWLRLASFQNQKFCILIIGLCKLQISIMNAFECIFGNIFDTVQTIYRIWYTNVHFRWTYIFKKPVIIYLRNIKTHSQKACNMVNVLMAWNYHFPCSYCHRAWIKKNVSLWRHHVEAFPRYWLIVRRIHRSPVKSTHKGPVMRILMFFYVGPRQLLNKQWNKRWLETTWSLCDVIVIRCVVYTI